MNQEVPNAILLYPHRGGAPEKVFIAMKWIMANIYNFA